MPLKKKGTPEKLKVVKDAELKKWEKIINEIVALGPLVEEKIKIKKNKR